MLSSFQNYLIFKTDELFNSHVKFKGIGGKDLVIDPTFNPQHHTRIYGEVVSVPKRLTKIPLHQIHRGYPSYHETNSTYEYSYLRDIELEVEVGDRVYYHFNIIPIAIRKDLFVKVDGVHPNRVWYTILRYDQVICSVRGGKIIPIGGYILVEPDFESWDEILKPVYYPDIKDKDGKPIPKPKEQWLQVKVQPEYKYLKGIVRHVGTPLKGQSIDVQPGQKIYHKRNADWMVRIEGKDYFVIKAHHVLGIQDDTVKPEIVPVHNHVLVLPDEMKSVTKAGIQLKRKPLAHAGTIVHPGNSGTQALDRVHFGPCDRTEIGLDKDYIVIHKNYIWGISEK